MEITDFTALITSAQALDPDTIIQFSYPSGGMKSIEEKIYPVSGHTPVKHPPAYSGSAVTYFALFSAFPM